MNKSLDILTYGELPEWEEYESFVNSFRKGQKILYENREYIISKKGYLAEHTLPDGRPYIPAIELTDEEGKTLSLGIMIGNYKRLKILDRKVRCLSCKQEIL